MPSRDGPPGPPGHPGGSEVREDASGDESDTPTVQAKPKKEKNRRPADTPFRQQRLKAYHPILTYKTIFPIFLGLGLVFGPLGGLFLYASAKVNEIEINYTRCAKDGSQTDEFTDMPPSAYKYRLKSTPVEIPPAKWRTFNDTTSDIEGGDQICQLRFTIPDDHPFESPIYLYYKLTNFFQNHRRYVKSFSTDQLAGEAVPAHELKSEDTCSPLVLSPEGKPYYPCGIIANSMFNDTFSSPVRLLSYSASGSNKNETYVMSNKNIAWGSDAERYGPTEYNYDDILPPPHWKKRFPDGYTKSNPPPDLRTWEEFQVWMRPAGLPTFTKLALRNDTHGMRPGVYQIEIRDRFNTMQWKGTKSIVITTRTVMGGKNNFLGIAYVVVAGVCAIIAAAVAARSVWKPRVLGDERLLSWMKEHPTKRAQAVTGNAGVGRQSQEGETGREREREREEIGTAS